MAQSKEYSLTVPQDATVQIIVNGRYWPNGPAPPHLQALPPAPPKLLAALPAPPQSPAPPTPPRGPNMGIPAGSPPRYYVGHPIYKENAALIVEPSSPEFVPLDSASFGISSRGFVLLQFAPAAGVRQYDWGRKQVFSLSVTEIGTLINLSTEESCEFFHFEANNITCDEGKGRQVLKIEPLPDGSGHLFNLRVQNKLLNIDESIRIPITRAEFTVLKSAFSFILPYLLGWHAFADSTKPDVTNRMNNANLIYGGDFQWSR
ncbi:hypothetical protein V6N12_011822 [Hibiscus sabdariffa]|uniref:Uncharacterized protein n=1 Tax=Hibiscus sabdariffa TaxID=183260 RepID=A0ABR2CGA2_9ROSI